MKDTLRLKHNFETIKKLRGDISNIFDTINSKINVLKKVYLDMILLQNSLNHYLN